MATLPFLQHLGDSTGWFGQSLITDMIAISEATPGPIGINMATYVGYQVCGIAGGLVATLGETIPSVIIVILVSRMLDKFRKNKIVDNAFYGLRPAVTGMIAAAGYGIIRITLVNMDAFLALHSVSALFVWPKIIMFAIAFFAIRKWKKHPVLYIAVAAVAGVALRLN